MARFEEPIEPMDLANILPRWGSGRNPHRAGISGRPRVPCPCCGWRPTTSHFAHSKIWVSGRQPMAAASARRLAATLLNLPRHAHNVLGTSASSTTCGAAENAEMEGIDGVEEKSRSQTASLEQRS